MIYKYFSRYEIRKYIDVLQDLVARYNNGYHRSIKTKPINVTKENELEVWINLYSNTLKKKKGKKKKSPLKVGDRVRITLE